MKTIKKLLLSAIMIVAITSCTEEDICDTSCWEIISMDIVHENIQGDLQDVVFTVDYRNVCTMEVSTRLVRTINSQSLPYTPPPILGDVVCGDDFCENDSNK